MNNYNNIKDKKNILPLSLITVVLVLLFFLSTGGLVLFLLNTTQDGLWKGYYTILVRNTVDYESILQKMGFADYISKNTQDVEFTIFGGLSRIKVGEVEDRFDPVDPRLDDYMKSLILYFEYSAEWDIVYVKEVMPVVLFSFTLYSQVSDFIHNWIVLDLFFLQSALLIGIGIVYFFLCLFLKRNRRYFFLNALGFLPWLFLLMNGSFLDLYHFQLVFPLWIFFTHDCLEHFEQLFIYRIRDKRKKNLIFMLIYFFIVYLCASCIDGINNISIWIRNLLPYAAGMSLLAAGIITSLIRHKYRKHSMVNPEEISQIKPPSLIQKFTFLFILILLTAFIQYGLYFYFLPVVDGAGIPVPVEDTTYSTITDSLTDSLTMEHLEQFNSLTHSNEIPKMPDIADYVLHMMYQEGLNFGEDITDFTIREINQSIFQYDKERNVIIKEKRIVKQFDDQWLNEILKSLSENRIEKMLIDQQRLVNVIYLSCGNNNAIPINPWKNLILLFFLFVPLLSAGSIRTLKGH